MPSESSRSGRAPCSVERRWLTLLVALGGLAAGCTAAGARPIEIAGGPSSLGGSSGSGGASTGPDDEPPPIFSEPPPPPPGPPDTCDKVDFLYVVDNSSSMLFEQQKLAQSFIGFSQIVDDVLGANDHQIMVVDTDAFNDNDSLNRDATEADSCVGVLGAGLRIGSEGQSCGIQGDQHFMLDRQPDAADTFSCLANVGILGRADEQPVAALLAATGATSSADAESCNAGFMREDAVLVVTIITDEEDEETPGTPEDWKRQLLAVKGGNEAGVVMLGLISDLNADGSRPPDGLCDQSTGAAPAPRLTDFVRSFERGSIGSICAGDYAQFFADAVSVIDTSCRDFAPLR